MRKVRRKHWWLVGFSLLGMLWLWRSSGRLQTSSVLGGYFAGAIDGIGSVDLGFWEDADHVTGSLVRSRVGEAYKLNGTRISDGRFYLAIASWTNGERVTNTVLGLALREGGRELDGQWKEMPSGSVRSFRLRRFASASMVKSSFSMRLGRWGHRRDFVCPVPQFDDFSARFQPAILDAIGRIQGEFMDDKLMEVWESLRWPSAANEWDFSAVCQMRRLDSNVCSLALSTYPYTGGNGNWQRYRTINLWNSNGWVTPFQMKDLFKSGSDWNLTLRVYCAGELHRLGASDYQDPGAETMDRPLDLFTVSADGIQIYFDPYTVGSGAEGSFVVHVPFSEIGGRLATNGPVKWP